MALRLDDDIRTLAETQQRRRREARKRVANQEIIGMRFLAEQDVEKAAARNLLRTPLVLADLADAANYGLELVRRCAELTQGDADGGL